MSDDGAEEEEQPGWLYDDNAGGFVIAFGKYRDNPQPIRDCDVDWLTFCATRGRPSNYVRFVQAYHRFMAGKIDHDHENPGEYIVSFGRKHRGHPLQKVRDRKWLRWIIKQAYMKAKYPHFVTVVERFLHVDYQHFEVMRDIGERVDLPEYDSTNEVEDDDEDYEADIREDQSDSDSLVDFVVPDDDLGDAQSEDDNASDLADGSITPTTKSKRRLSTKRRSALSDDSDDSWYDEGHRTSRKRNGDSAFCVDDTHSKHDDSSYEESETRSSTSSSADDAASADSSNSSRSSTLQPEDSSTHNLGYTFRLGQQHVSRALEHHVNEATCTPRRGRHRRVTNADSNSQSECDETLYSTSGSRQTRGSVRKTFSTRDLGSSFRMGGHLRSFPDDGFGPWPSIKSKRKGKHSVGDDESDSGTEDERPAQMPRKRRRSPSRSISPTERRSPKTPRKPRRSPSRSVSPMKRRSRTSPSTRRFRSPSASEMGVGRGSPQGVRDTTPRSAIRRSKARKSGSFSASSSTTPQSMRRLGAPSSSSPVKRRLFLSHVEIPPTPHLDRTKYRSMKEIISSSPLRIENAASETRADECEALAVTPRKRNRSVRIVSSDDEDED
ncbi:hypothetical protein BD410DRAFT_782115 [Rickenella mellea]|uniref:Uncharacterized protein n=1 Tax=Rickenella mellea TaxID=50990 RepID=A0A4Y7QKG8_9AGAM|nr:hypothetical protein BD410DRAFT_782115 [Rickenella mellea]